MLCPFENFLLPTADQAGEGEVSTVVERGLDSFSVIVWKVGDRTQGFRR